MNTLTAPILTAYTRYCLEASNAEIQSRNITEANQKKVDALADNSENREPRATNTATINELMVQPERSNWDDKRDYGNRHAYITKVSLFGKDGHQTNTPDCGEIVRLEITALCNRFIESFVAGFVVRDRTGQVIFGENSIGQDRLQATKNQNLSVSFEFVMPFLQPGSYSLSAAVSNGDAKQFQVMHYKPDVLVLEPMVGDRPVQGVFATTTMAIQSSYTDKSELEGLQPGL